MRHFSLLGLLAMFLLLSTVAAQDDANADEAPADGADGAEGDDKAAEECEEAWEYVEFLKESVK